MPSASTVYYAPAPRSPMAVKAALKKLHLDNFDKPGAARPRPHLPELPPWDAYQETLDLGWENLLPDLSSIEGIFPEDKLPKVRLVTKAEIFFYGQRRHLGEDLRASFDPLYQSLAMYNTSRREFQAFDRTPDRHSTFITCQPYPEILRSEEGWTRLCKAVVTHFTHTS